MHVTPIQVRFGDTDALGHVNNAVFATYAETARIEFFREQAGLYSVPGDTGGFILARLAIDFRSQVKLGQQVEVRSRIAKLGNSSITMTQQILADGVVAAEIEAVAVSFDYEEQRPVRIPQHIRELAERQLGEAG